METGIDEEFDALRETFFEGNSGSSLIVAHLEHVVGVEGSFHVNEFVDQNAETPNVHLFVLLLLVGDFGGQILSRATHGLPDHVEPVGSTKAEIADLGLLVVSEKNVFGLDVPMDVLPLVNVLEPLENFLGETKNFTFGEKLAFEVIEERAPFDELQNDVEIICV